MPTMKRRTAAPAKPRKLTAKEAERREAIVDIKRFVRPGDAIFCNLEHVSSTGMSRIVSFHVFRGPRGNDHRDLTWLVHKILGYPHRKIARTGGMGLYVEGGGMDMGWDVVDRLAKAVFGPKASANNTLKPIWI